MYYYYYYSQSKYRDIKGQVAGMRGLQINVLGGTQQMNEQTCGVSFGDNPSELIVLEH